MVHVYPIKDGRYCTLLSSSFMYNVCKLEASMHHAPVQVETMLPSKDSDIEWKKIIYSSILYRTHCHISLKVCNTVRGVATHFKHFTLRK